MVSPHVVWVGHIVIGRSSTKRLAPCCQSWSRTFWGETRSPPRLPSLLGELVDRSSAGIGPSWLVCPSAHGPRLCCFSGSARADHRLEPCRLIESLGELWWARGKTTRHPSSLCAFGRVLGMGFNEGTPTSWGRLPLASSYSPGGSGVVVRSPGRRSGPTLPHREAKVSEWGRLPMIGASSSLGTPRDASGC